VRHATIKDEGIIDIRSRRNRCSKSGKVGHYKNTCINTLADFYNDYEGDVIALEDLLDGTYSSVHGTQVSYPRKLST